MSIRTVSLAVGLMLCFATGCKKSNSPAESQAKQADPQPGAQKLAMSADTVARLHWLGKKRVAADPNSASLMEIWNLAESARLEGQTLDKLALAPWRSEIQEIQLLATNYYPITNFQSFVAGHAEASRLRPLLEDLLQEESHLELRQPTNGPAELVLAIRLSDQRANVWQQDLAKVLEAVAGAAPKPAVQGPAVWRLDVRPGENTNHSALGQHVSSITLGRASGWTLLTLTMAGQSSGANGDSGNPLLEDFARRIKSEQPPFEKKESGFWLDATADTAKLQAALKPECFSRLLNLFSSTNYNLPTLSLAVGGDGRNVRVRGDLEFPQALALELEHWDVPTNLVRDPLVGFMAIRGLRPLLSAFKPWQDAQLGTPPNQVFFWAQSGLPRFHFMAAPSAEASNQVVKLSELILTNINPIVATNRMRLGTFEPLTNLTGVKWKGFAMLQPDLYCTNFGGTPFIIAGFSAGTLTNFETPPELLQQLDAGTNLVWYDWEFTGRCAEGLATMSQLVRNVLSHGRLTYTTGLSWLAAASPKLGNSITGIKLMGPTHLSMSRVSTIGITGVEMNLLIDWLESPAFPYGLHSLLTPEPSPPPQTHQ